jgi:Soluble lytic murein transglycosylase and related regulatory proteins (some contain LysM/invasin domains)
MSEIRTSRLYRERFLDGFDRSLLRQEIETAKPRRLSGLRKKYAGWALGASLALGGIGFPLKVGSILQPADADARHQAVSTSTDKPLETTSLSETGAQITGDLATAKQIAEQVAGGITSGVRGAVQDVARTVAATPSQVAEGPQTIADVAERLKEKFFQREVPFGGIIYSEARKNDLPPELVAAVVHTESQFVPTALSNRGAIGLMQIAPKTGRWLGASNLSDPAQNIRAGTKYLRYLTDRFDGDQAKAIAAYNAGEGNVRRFGGVPPFKETRNYVQRVRSFQQDLGARVDGQSVEASAAQ